jgi:hypothetical protein
MPEPGSSTQPTQKVAQSVGIIRAANADTMAVGQGNLDLRCRRIRCNIGRIDNRWRGDYLKGKRIYIITARRITSGDVLP